MVDLSKNSCRAQPSFRLGRRTTVGDKEENEFSISKEFGKKEGGLRAP